MKDLHCVIISFNKPLPNLEALYETDKKFMSAIESAEAGIYDYHGTADDNSAGDFFMYGPDADKLFEVVKPVIDSTNYLKGGFAFLRYGETRDAKTRIIQL
jgi:hypothetical protein